jgi:peptidoglycan hydrolase CwlO-like protein
MSYIRVVLLFFSLMLVIVPKVGAQQVCQEQDPCANKSKDEKVACYENVLSQCGQARETLSSQINYMNNQIQLTTYRIESVKVIILKLTSEIKDLENEVQRLEGVLTQRSELILHRIPESYKRVSGSQFGMLLLSQDFSDFILRAKYISTVQQQDAALLLQLKATQNNFSERKTLREDKKKQQEQAQLEYEAQTQRLVSQKRQKDALLEQTRNSEANYRQLLQEARAQLQAIQNFVTNLGGASILNNQTVCNDWGCYYNQRDSQWANHTIGSSGESIANVGCLVTSVAMLLTHYGKKVTPADVASTLDAFVPGYAYMYFRPWSVNGATVYRTSMGAYTGNIDGQLSGGNPVIVGIGSGPAHFIVLKSGTNGNYVMNDPFLENGHDVSFSSKYSIGSITEVDRVVIN